MITNEDENFVKDEQRAGVDANYYARKQIIMIKIHLVVSLTITMGNPIVSLTHVNHYGGQDKQK